MRTFNFKVRNIGQEKYLTYTMDAECELDEDVLDYCEENDLQELIDIIYEETEDYDYLTYNITGKTSLEEYIEDEMSCEKVLFILRNVANGLISLKEQAIHLAYVLMNRKFIYINEQNYEISFICLPVESKGSIASEFKGFVRQLLANMKYDIDDELSYVGKLLTYINGDSFNLRGLIGLSEALMEEANIDYEEAGSIDADGVEVFGSEVQEEPDKSESDSNVADFMNSLSEQGEVLPEIGDDDEEDIEDFEDEINDEELESILPAGMKSVADSNDDIPEIEIESGSTEELITETDVNSVETVKESVENITNADISADAVKEDATAPEIEEIAAENIEQEKVPEIKREDVSENKPEQTLKEGTVPVQRNPLPRPRNQKESDINLIKNRIRELVGDVSSSTKSGQTEKNINSLEDLDKLLDSKPPVIKKNVVKVNRAALIQSAAADHEAEHEESPKENPTENIKVPVIEEVIDDINEKNEQNEKPKSNSVLSKTVTEPTKANTLLNAPKAIPYLVRVNTEERIMLGKIIFKIGKASRGVDYTVSGNGAISRQHAIITQKDGVCYIKDNKSTNHTYVNDKKVDEGVEEILTHDSMIKLGDEEFVFKIR